MEIITLTILFVGPSNIGFENTNWFNSYDLKSDLLAFKFFYNDTWIWPQNYDLLFMVASGFLGFIAQICLTKSFQLADASLLAPLDFSSVIWSFFIGYIFFQEFITLNVFIGGLIIILSVSYIFYRERVLKKQIVLGTNKQF